MNGGFLSPAGYLVYSIYYYEKSLIPSAKQICLNSSPLEKEEGLFFLIKSLQIYFVNF